MYLTVLNKDGERGKELGPVTCYPQILNFLSRNLQLAESLTSK